MRTHFLSRLALLLMGAFGVVASQVWTGNTLQWIFAIGGALTILGALADTGRSAGVAPALDGAIAIVGAWTIAEAFLFENTNLQWWSFGSAVALVVLSTLGLLMHERGMMMRHHGHGPGAPAAA